VIRPAREEDLTFVRSSWLASYFGSPWGRSLDRHNPQIYWAGHRSLVARLTELCLVLVDVADDGVIDGWICGKPVDVLHYVYVRQASRGTGVAKRLAAALGLARDVRCSHAQWSKMPPTWRYDPYLLTEMR
jgi:GNAT superfamily N-acetyltransferase